MKIKLKKTSMILMLICFWSFSFASPMLDFIKSNKGQGIIDRTNSLILTIILLFLAFLFLTAAWIVRYKKKKKK